MLSVIDNILKPDSQQKNDILSDNVKESLGKLIQRRLRELNLSKAELSRRLGVSRSYVVNMANETAPTKSGQYNPSQETIEKLARHLQVSVTEILQSLGYDAKHSPVPEPVARAFARSGNLRASDLELIANFVEMLENQRKKEEEKEEEEE